MLEVKPCTVKHILLPYLRKNRLVYSEAFYLYRAMDGDEVLAVCLFEVLSNEVRAVYYEAQDMDDHFLFDAVLRAGLNYAAGHDIPAGYLSEEFRLRHEALFEKLNFPLEYRFDITNFFQKYKNCAPIL